MKAACAGPEHVVSVVNGRAIDAELALGLVSVNADSEIVRLASMARQFGRVAVVEGGAGVGRRLDAALVVAPSLTSAVERRVDKLLALHPYPPIVLITDYCGAGDFLGPRQVTGLCNLHGLSLRRLKGAVRLARRDSVFLRFAHDLTSAGPMPDHRLVRRGLAVLTRPSSVAAPLKTIGQLAAALGCSGKHLSRLFRKEGLMLGPMVRWCRLLHLMTLKGGDDVSWSEVSLQAGFDTPSAMSHFVRALTGKTPTAAARLSWSHWRRRAALGCRVSENR